MWDNYIVTVEATGLRLVLFFSLSARKQASNPRPTSIARRMKMDTILSQKMEGEERKGKKKQNKTFHLL